MDDQHSRDCVKHQVGDIFRFHSGKRDLFRVEKICKMSSNKKIGYMLFYWDEAVSRWSLAPGYEEPLYIAHTNVDPYSEPVGRLERVLLTGGK